MWKTSTPFTIRDRCSEIISCSVFNFFNQNPCTASLSAAFKLIIFFTLFGHHFFLLSYFLAVRFSNLPLGSLAILRCYVAPLFSKLHSKKFCLLPHYGFLLCLDRVNDSKYNTMFGNFSLYYSKTARRYTRIRTKYVVLNTKVVHLCASFELSDTTPDLPEPELTCYVHSIMTAYQSALQSTNKLLQKHKLIPPCNN